ncbi:MAG: amino acid permease [Gemmatimonadales bacterium]|nr:amino acid permease [Gemmatimonadales bacterium]
MGHLGHDAVTQYARRLGVFSGTMAVIGGIIGSGIFLNPPIVAQRVGTGPLVLAVWGLGAVVAIAGALIFAELGQRMPRAGGQYAYLRAAFGPLAGFLDAWALLLIIATGAIAAVAFTFASYLTALLGLPAGATTPVAAGAIALLTLINILGVAWGAWVQNVFTILKLAAIAILIGVALLGPAPEVATAAAAGVAPSNLWLAIASALVPVLFSYGGWQQTNNIAEEFVDPVRQLPKAIILGVLVVVLAYVGTNAAYLKALGATGLAASPAPAAETIATYLGPAGRRLISAGIVASTFGFLGLTILASPRVYQAMARDGLFFDAFSRLHPRFQTPVGALLFQGGWAIALLLTNAYGQLLDYVVFADWIFFGSTGVALVVLRRREPVTTGFRCPAFPLTVTVFVAAAAYVVFGSVWSNPMNALRGAGLLLLGVPVYWWRARAGAAR